MPTGLNPPGVLLSPALSSWSLQCYVCVCGRGHTRANSWINGIHSNGLTCFLVSPECFHF